MGPTPCRSCGVASPVWPAFSRSICCNWRLANQPCYTARHSETSPMLRASFTTKASRACLRGRRFLRVSSPLRKTTLQLIRESAVAVGSLWPQMPSNVRSGTTFWRQLAHGTVRALGRAPGLEQGGGSRHSPQRRPCTSTQQSFAAPCCGVWVCPWWLTERTARVAVRSSTRKGSTAPPVCAQAVRMQGTRSL